ncbi:hypothetical protein FBU30_002206, partial [Linnemannia zychae]
MEEEINPIATAGPVSGQEPSVLLLKHYIYSLSNLLSIMDDGVTIPNLGGVLGSLKKSNELCQEHIPVQPTHSLSRKRARLR